MRADYYHYSGEYGVENDKGFRYANASFGTCGNDNGNDV